MQTYSKSKIHDAAMKHHGVGYDGIPEDASKRPAAVLHSGVGYTGFPKKITKPISK